MNRVVREPPLRIGHGNAVPLRWGLITRIISVCAIRLIGRLRRDGFQRAFLHGGMPGGLRLSCHEKHKRFNTTDTKCTTERNTKEKRYFFSFDKSVIFFATLSFGSIQTT
jgi:hypothetical protein